MVRVRKLSTCKSVKRVFRYTRFWRAIGHLLKKRNKLRSFLLFLLLLGVSVLGPFHFHRSVHSSTSTDIVIVTHNALKYAQAGLLAVKKNTNWMSATLTLVDSGSDEDSIAWFVSFCVKWWCQLYIKGNIGYTEAVNFGVRQTTSKLLVIMNPDVIVFPNWLEGLSTCLHSCSTHGIVGPLSNAASFQNFPFVYDTNGNHAINKLETAMEQRSVSLMIQNLSIAEYPIVTYINGFLFMLRREVFEKLGGFDQKLFPTGYGEENDFSIRAQDAGYTLAIDDTTFAYHFKTTGFSQEQRLELSKSGKQANLQRHTDKYKLYLNYMKAQVDFLLTRNTLLDEMQLAYKPDQNLLDKKIVYLLPIRGRGGGVISVVQEVTRMRKWNAPVSIAVWREDYEYYTEYFRTSSDVFVNFVTIEHLVRLIAGVDIIVATHFTSIGLIKSVLGTIGEPIHVAYYVQDYEPYFFEEKDPQRSHASESYEGIQNMLLFAKTHWIKNTVESQHDTKVEVIRASVDHSLFRPNPCPKARQEVVLAAMIRPSTPRRGATRTLRVLTKLKKTLGSNVYIVTFGCTTREIRRLGFKTFDEHVGLMNRQSIASLFSDVDIFIDLSDYQAFGRSVAECMASGCIPVGPKRGATNELIAPGVNGLIVNPEEEAATIDQIASLIKQNPDSRRYMKMRAIIRASEWTIDAAAEDQLQLFKQLTLKRASKRTLSN